VLLVLRSQDIACPRLPWRLDALLSWSPVHIHNAIQQRGLVDSRPWKVRHHQQQDKQLSHLWQDGSRELHR
jgi:hypothetical protein